MVSMINHSPLNRYLERSLLIKFQAHIFQCKPMDEKIVHKSVHYFKRSKLTISEEYFNHLRPYFKYPLSNAYEDNIFLSTYRTKQVSFPKLEYLWESCRLQTIKKAELDQLWSHHHKNKTRMAFQ